MQSKPDWRVAGLCRAESRALQTYLIRAAGPARAVELSQNAPTVGRPLSPPPLTPLFPATVRCPPLPSLSPRGGVLHCPSRFRIPERAAAAAAENARGIGRCRRPRRRVVVVVVQNTFYTDGQEGRREGRRNGSTRGVLTHYLDSTFTTEEPGTGGRTTSGLNFEREQHPCRSHSRRRAFYSPRPHRHVLCVNNLKQAFACVLLLLPPCREMFLATALSCIMTDRGSSDRPAAATFTSCQKWSSAVSSGGDKKN